MSGTTVFHRIILATVLSGLIVALPSCASSPDTTTPSQARTVAVQRGDLTSYVTATGSLAFAQTREMAFLVNGTVVELNVKEGAPVTKGQVLARLYLADFQKALDAAEAAARSAEIGLQEAKDAESGVKAAEVDLEAAVTSYRKLSYPYDYQTFAFDAVAAIAGRIRAGVAEQVVGRGVFHHLGVDLAELVGVEERAAARVFGQGGERVLRT